MPDADERRRRPVLVTERHGRGVVDAGMPEHGRSARRDLVGLARGPSTQRSTSTSWIECSSSVPPPALSTSAAPRRAVHPLDREVLVVPEHGRERPAVPALGDELGRGAEDRGVAQHQPDLVRDASENAGEAFGVRQRRRQGLLAEDGAGPRPPRPRTASRCAAGPRAHPHDVDLGEQLGELLVRTAS